MRKITAVVGSAIFLVVAPGTLAGLVPWWITRWVVQPPLFVVARVGGQVCQHYFQRDAAQASHMQCARDITFLAGMRREVREHEVVREARVADVQDKL